MKKDNKKKKTKNNNMGLAIRVGIFIVVTFVALGAITYGAFITTDSQSDTNKMTSGCFSTTFTEGNSIHLTNAYAMTNAQGLATTPYHFTLKNTCTIKVKYTVLLNVKDNSFSDSYVRASLDGTTSKLVSAFTANTNTSYVENGYTNSYVLLTGTLAQNATLTTDLRVWIDEAVTYENVEDGSWQGQIKIENVATN